MLSGGKTVGYSDNHYGHARNVINPGRARIMAEGWETARRVSKIKKLLGYFKTKTLFLIYN